MYIVSIIFNSCRLESLFSCPIHSSSYWSECVSDFFPQLVTIAVATIFAVCNIKWQWCCQCSWETFLWLYICLIINNVLIDWVVCSQVKRVFSNKFLLGLLPAYIPGDGRWSCCPIPHWVILLLLLFAYWIFCPGGTMGLCMKRPWLCCIMWPEYGLLRLCWICWLPFCCPAKFLCPSCWPRPPFLPAYIIHNTSLIMNLILKDHSYYSFNVDQV